jgi:molecular chaperone DnaJ
MNKDYYKILGVAKNAAEDEIKKAYRKLAHQHHPDKKGGNADEFKAINEAYQVLSNKEKRAQYDKFGRVFDGAQGGPQQGGANPFSGFGFDVNFDPGMFEGMEGSDIFEAFFEGMGIKNRRRTYERGADLEFTVSITLEEVFTGVAKIIPTSRFAVCKECSGQGSDPKAGVTQCATCSGQGEVRETRRGFFGNSVHVKQCASCMGTGTIPNKKCTGCGGVGRIKEKTNISFTVMTGIEDGQIIKISGAGDKGARGAEAGDAYVRISVEKNKAFERRGPDLITKKEISALDILLDKKLDIMSIGGDTYSFDIPESTPISDAIRIAGAGMPRLGSRTRGDLYVKLVIVKPKKLSTKAKGLLEDLKKELE